MKAPAEQDPLLRGLGVVGVLGIALIHLLDLPRALREVAYLPVLYLLLIAGCLVAGWLLLRSEPRLGWVLAGSLAAATFLAFVVSRTIGLPGNPDDIGHWTEPLGLASLFVEGWVAALSVGAIALAGSARSGRIFGASSVSKSAHLAQAVSAFEGRR
jgi:hypothetical protein